MRMVGKILERLIASIACLALAGCASNGAINLPRPASAAHAHLIELPGMGGLTDIDKDFLHGLKEGGVADQTEIYDWTGPNKWIAAVRAWDHNKTAARQVAEKISAKFHQDPSTQMVLAAWTPDRP